MIERETEREGVGEGRNVVCELSELTYMIYMFSCRCPIHIPSDIHMIWYLLFEECKCAHNRHFEHDKDLMENWDVSENAKKKYKYKCMVVNRKKTVKFYI